MVSTGMGKAAAAWMLAGCLAMGGVAPLRAQPLGEAVPGAASADTTDTVRWVLATDDHRHQPFAVVDKRDARIHVFAPDGRWLGSSPTLLGLTPGDAVVGDPSSRPPAALRAEERTTPAGRYASEPGRNLGGEDIVWLDYANKLAIHRVRPGEAERARLQRLASPWPADRRVSAGCVVVPVVFYETVVRPVLGGSRGVVYVLPEAGLHAGGERFFGPPPTLAQR